jgi:hypothetical protein
MHTGVEGGDSGNLNTVPAFYASVSGCSTFPSRRKGTFFLAGSTWAALTLRYAWFPGKRRGVQLLVGQPVRNEPRAV